MSTKLVDVYDREDVELLPLDVLDVKEDWEELLNSMEEWDYDAEYGYYFLDRYADRTTPFYGEF